MVLGQTGPHGLSRSTHKSLRDLNLTHLDAPFDLPWFEGIARRVTPAASATTQRTTLCGALRVESAGQSVRLGGWVHRTRNLGGMVFVDLRDRAGIVQVSFNPEYTAPAVIQAADFGVGERRAHRRDGGPASRRDAQYGDGDGGPSRGHATAICVWSGPATTPAIPVASARGGNLPSEELRLRHRYLDLRRPDLREEPGVAAPPAASHSALSGRARLSRNRDALSCHQADARRGARLSRP